LAERTAPDLYNRFALQTTGLMEELRGLADLTGLTVRDVGAGTGRSAIGAAETARHVIASDAFASVVRFGRDAA
jgi:predicted RNA methylase